MNGLEIFTEPTRRWFEESVGQPTAVQREGWPAIASGDHALLSAPTGTGKTLAAFLVFVDRLSARKQAGELREGLHVLYISPLKSLGNDIRENLKRPIEGIPAPDIKVAVRNGDTEPKERRKIAEHPPHILITTPESLFLMLTSDSGRRVLKTTQTVIVDELHAMIDTKRGAHLMLSLARLDALCGRPVQRIALSATIRPLETAAKYLAGEARVNIVAPPIKKDSSIEVQSIIPDMRVLPEGSIWNELYQKVYALCQNARTVIAFMEGRAQSEKLAHGVNEIAGHGFARTHHGCISKEQRLEAEKQLKSGQLRLLCATSSMELGIDVGEVDLVLQVGCPLGVSNALQRLGRAGHNPGRTSVMRVFPKTPAEIVPCGMTASAALSGAIEPASPPEKCLDIVSQHLVSMAATGLHSVAELHKVIQSAHSFRDVTISDVESCLRMLAGDYEHADDRPAHPRLLYDRIHGAVSGDNYTKMLALSSSGTIPDRGMFPAMLRDGTRLGELDEEFVFERRIGEKFLLGSFAWKLMEVRKDRVIVEPAGTEGAMVPFWRGDGRGRSYEIGLRFGAYLRSLNDAHATGRMIETLRALHMDEAAARNALLFVERQIEATGCLPDDQTIILEHFRDNAGEDQLMVHSTFGGRVNLALGMLFQHAATRITGLDVQCYSDDDGFLLYLSGAPVPDGLLAALPYERAQDVVRAMLPQAPLFQMGFRYNANRAMLMGVRRGTRVPLWVQRMRGAEALSGAAKYPDHPLMIETMRECLNDYMDLPAMEKVLSGIRSGAIRVIELRLGAPSPMALPLRRQVEAELMYEYSPTPASAMRASFKALDELDADETIAPDASILDATTQQRPTVESAEKLHALLMAEGDIVAGEVEAPVAWLEELSRKGRARYVEPGLWIAEEHAETYERALEQGDPDARARIVRRCLRFRGAQTPSSLFERYLIPEDQAEAILRALVEDKQTVERQGTYYHAELFQRAVSQTVRMRRTAALTREPARFAHMLSLRARFAGSPKDQLQKALDALSGAKYPADAWENVLLPARVAGYKPRLLDDLLGEGAVCWRLDASDRLSASFHRAEDIDYDAPLPGTDTAEFSDDEKTILNTLRRRGASFASALTVAIEGRSALDALESLAAKGLVSADSFQPVRLLLERPQLKQTKQLVRSRANAQGAGRWEIARPPIAKTVEQAVEALFERYALLCRETCDGVRWGEALELLRVWEYTGRVRRGYFVRGLSGAQFIRSSEYERVLHQMAGGEGTEGGEIIWLNATDPMQAWGRILPHDERRAFMLVPGTSVAMCDGEPVMVLEKGGESLRIFDEAQLEPALKALKSQFELSRIYPNLKKLTIRKPMDAAKAPLEQAGFQREMMDYVLWRNAIYV